MGDAGAAEVAAAPRFEPVPLHFKIPHGIFLIEATSVAVDSHDHVYVFNRGNVPVLVFDPEGNLVRHWGNPNPFEGTEPQMDLYGHQAVRFKNTEYVHPHAVTIDHEDNVWLVDDLANTITKCDRFGRRLMVLLPGGRVVTDAAEMAALAGTAADAAALQSGDMFNRPTDICVHPHTGDLFITDGYGNSAVHHLRADGSHVASWGRSGTDPGEFNLPHNICLHPDLDKVMVADRENNRVQLFTLEGVFVAEWAVHRAVALCSGRGPLAGDVLVAELGSHSPVQRGLGHGRLDTWTPRIGHRVCLYDVSAGRRRKPQIGAERPGEQPDALLWPHSLAMDSRGSLYVAEVSFCECGRLQQPHAREMVSLRKWRLAPAEA